MEPVTVAVTLSAFAVVTKGIIDVLRRQWPRFDGLAVNAAAVTLGTLEAWAFDLQATQALLNAAGATMVGRIPIDPIDFLITGGAIAFAAGLLAEFSGRSGNNNNAVVVEVDADGRVL